MIWKKGYKWTYLQTTGRVTGVENKPGAGGVGRDKLGDWNWHLHTAVYKIHGTSIDRVDANENLLYRIGNSTQYSVMAYIPKEPK